MNLANKKIMKKLVLSILTLLALCTGVNAQNVNIPDANFKNYLLGHTAINTNSDTEIQVSEASAFTGTINCPNLSIADLTGIEAFTALTQLLCEFNSLTSLDVSNNTALTVLFCYNNSLTSLDVANGNNTNMGSSTFNANNNPNLTCIQVDDVAYSTTNWTNIDAASSFNTSCPGAVLVNSITVQGQGGASTITTQGGTLQMEATVLPANADDATYTWSVANGTGAATIDANGLLTATANGTVEVTATANDASNVTDSETITISNQTTGTAILVSSISVQGQGGASTITTNGGTLQMGATVLPANADDATFTWSVANGTGAATIDANGLLTATADGTVEVTATANDASGVSDSETITISNQSVGVGINELAFEALNIYPNPTNNIVNLEVSEKLRSIKLFDLAGKVVKTFKPENTQLDVSNLNAGIYFLEIANAEKKAMLKLIKK